MKRKQYGRKRSKGRGRLRKTRFKQYSHYASGKGGVRL